jgi:hypothetical protein
MISSEKKFLFVRIPKTAGTTIQTAISRGQFIDLDSFGAQIQFCKEGDASWARDAKTVKNKSKYINFFDFAVRPDSFIHACYQDWEEAYDLNGYFSFSFVRNPWEWVVSQYLFLRRVYLRRLNNERRGRPSRKRYFANRREDFSKKLSNFGLSYEEFRLNQELLSFESYVEAYFSEDSFNKTQSSFLKNKEGEIAVDFIGKFENLQSDWEFIAKKINSEQIPLKDTNSSGDRSSYDSYYESAEIKKIVTNGLAEDIERFGYEFGD